MFISENSEEVLEALWIASMDGKNNIIKTDSLRCPIDENAFTELEAAGMIKKKGTGEIEVTPEGLAECASAARRHRLAERLLTDILAVKKEDIHSAACRFEHHLHEGIDENICTLLGHPRFCPHGSPIPKGKCCEEGRRTVLPAISKLADMKPGSSGRIAYLSTKDPKHAQMLISMGAVPGAQITMLAGYPSYLFQVGEGQLAIDKEMASEIYVRKG